MAALIALMASLMLPSLQGLFGVAGRRGGANLLAGGLEQARLVAIEKGVSAYLAFPADNLSDEVSASSFTIYRERTEDEKITLANSNPVSVSRWFRLPRGVFIDPKSIKDSFPTNKTGLANVLPRLGTSPVSTATVVEFDRFGRIRGNANELRTLLIGEGVFSGGTVTFRPATNDYYAVTLYPMTGRVSLTDNLRENP